MLARRAREGMARLVTPVELVRSRVKGLATGGKTAHCPAHDDKRNSLSIDGGSDGRVLLKCHAGCAVGEICKALGLEFRDLFPENGGTSLKRTIAATYDYRDERGELLYQAVRFNPKDFQQRCPDGNGGWRWSLNGVRRVPYRLPGLLLAPAVEVVWITEGEKDVENLIALGLTATTNAGGGGKWRAEYDEPFRGRRVAILPDNDDMGEKHARSVARHLITVATEVRILRLPGLPPKGDVSDWLRAGGTKDELLRLHAETHQVVAEDLVDSVPRPWVRIADVQRESVRWLWQYRVPFGKLTTVDGDPGLGKSTLMTEIAARATTGRPLPGGRSVEPCGVVFLSAEDSLADTIRPRLEAAGADLSRVLAMTEILELPKALPSVEEAVREVKAGLVVIDPLVAYLGAETNTFRDQDVRRALGPISEFADRTGAAVVMIRHLNKKTDGGNPLYRGGGSIGIIGAARSGLLIAKDPEDEERRILAVLKANLCFPPAALSFRLQTTGEAHRIEWLGENGASGTDLLGGQQAAEEKGALEHAKDVLREILGGGPIAARAAQKQAQEAGISSRTLDRAKATLRVVATKAVVTGTWTWSIPRAGKTAKPREDDRPTDKIGDLDENSPVRTTTNYTESLDERQHRQECQGIAKGTKYANLGDVEEGLL